MAIPVNPIEVWASEDYILPDTHELNKERPIDDLWKKGYDMGQKPSVEHWNYLFNLLTDWVRYLDQDAIPALDERYFKVVNNLSEVVDKSTAQSNLDVYGKAQSDALFVNISGDTMTGPLAVPTINVKRINVSPADSDFSWITTTIPAADTTYLDIGIGDNYGPTTVAQTDRIRFRFLPAASSGSPEFSMAELSAISPTSALFRVFGSINSTTASVDGNLSWGGAGTGNSLRLTQSADVDSLSVRSNTATVNGRSIVRSVNGILANAAGNVTLNVGVQDVRWSATQAQLSPDFISGPPLGDGRRSRTSNIPAGAVVTQLADASTQELWIEDVDVVYYRFLQKQIGGTWVTVGVA